MAFFSYPQRPKEENTTTPRAIGGLVGAFLIVIIGFFTLALADNHLLQSGQLAAVVVSTLEDLANGDRVGNAVTPLEISPLLTQVAQAKANDMAANSYFAHTSPEGKSPWYWFQQGGYAFQYAGENLAVDFNDSMNINSAWMNSPEHRANLLDDHFTQIGIATAQGTYKGHPTIFVVEEFGTPAYAQSAPVRTITEPTIPTEPALATTESIASTTLAESVGIATSAPSSTLALVAPATTSVATSSVLGSSIASAPSGSLLSRVVTSPLTTLHWAYYLLAVLLLVLLLYVTRFEFKRHHLHHFKAAGALLALMFCLLFVANIIFFASPVIAASGV